MKTLIEQLNKEYGRTEGETAAVIREAATRIAKLEAELAEMTRQRDKLLPIANADDDPCEDCPPVGYPTDKTRCAPCPRREKEPPCS